jgi:anti-sigma-K factor RskA
MDRGVCGDNAAPYVLGALPDDEHRAFVLHMESCGVCREEVAALQVVASALPAVTPQLSAPAQLKERVMAEVAEDERALASASGERTRRQRGHAPAWLGWRPLLASGALAAAAVVVAVIAIASGGSGAEGTRVIRAEVTARNASALLRVSDDHAQLDVSGLPQTPPQRVYEVWIKRSGAAQPTDALFTVTSKGDATVGVPGSFKGVRVVMVTSEPLGGSTVPTNAPVILARVE